VKYAVRPTPKYWRDRRIQKISDGVCHRDGKPLGINKRTGQLATLCRECLDKENNKQKILMQELIRYKPICPTCQYTKMTTQDHSTCWYCRHHRIRKGEF